MTLPFFDWKHRDYCQCLVLYNSRLLKSQKDNNEKHRHQRCKASSLCITFFFTNICRLKEAGQKNIFFITSFLQRLSHNIFLTTSFSLRLSHNIFLTSFSQRLSHNAFLPASFSHRCPYIIIHIT